VAVALVTAVLFTRASTVEPQPQVLDPLRRAVLAPGATDARDPRASASLLFDMGLVRRVGAVPVSPDPPRGRQRVERPLGAVQQLQQITERRHERVSA
jgi:uncharacterized heparinase superfamily protein